ncbi:hypothetical protein DYE49_10920 [Treponema rectale]|uniref:Uncharacterized protein n=1 Tax=Treponema rectale TaxID=744512 RepID=A0A840SE70_9SPIR|nr:hypothetical protein [Treponema rectale]MBB5219174.1 hypothetical protein [Treponema rectale]QOS40929.1 hypothetical protein DYE49_10920 [Treponema rectale]
MKKTVLCMFLLAATGLAFALNVSKYNAKELKKSGAETFITDEESFEEFQEKYTDKIAADPLIGFFLNAGENEDFVSAIEKCGDNISEEFEEFYIRLSRQAEQFDAAYENTGYGEVDFTLKLPKNAFKPLQKTGLTIDLPSTKGVFALSADTADENNVNITLDVDYEASVVLDPAKALGKQAAESMFKDLRFSVAVYGKVYVNADNDILPADFDLDGYFDYVNSATADISIAIYGASAFNSDGTGGKVISDFTFGYKGNLTEDVIEKVVTAYGELINLFSDSETEVDEELFRSLPFTVHIGQEYYNDKNQLTYVAVDESDPYECMCKLQEVLQNVETSLNY